MQLAYIKIPAGLIPAGWTPPAEGRENPGRPLPATGQSAKRDALHP
jgi:hypothetical protein